MNRASRHLLLSVLLVAAFGLSLTAGVQEPAPPERTRLQAAVSLTDRDLAYGGTDKAAGDDAVGDVFGWRDGSIRLVGSVDSAGGCAEPRSIAATVEGRQVRVDISPLPVGAPTSGMAACPAVFTPQVFYARIWGLKPGRYDVRIRAERWFSLPVPRNGVDVPATSAPPL